MTANKHFKRRVRERARRTGESYTAALAALRRERARRQAMQWQRIEKPDFGYAVRIPQGWDERPPNLKNSPWETARFDEAADRRHLVIVFRQPIKPARGALEVAQRVQPSLERTGFTDFELADAVVGGAPGAVLRCAKHDAGRSWHVTQYLRIDGQVSFCLGCGTAVPAEDDELFTSMADTFELLG